MLGDNVADGSLALYHLDSEHLRCVHCLLVYGTQHGWVFVSLDFLFIEFRQVRHLCLVEKLRYILCFSLGVL